MKSPSDLPETNASAEATGNESSLAAFLADSARDASDTSLVAAFTIGFNVALTAVVWRGPGWLLLASAAASIFAFGLWGIADRELGDGSPRSVRAERGLRFARVMAGIIGGASFATFFLVFLGFALGRLIS